MAVATELKRARYFVDGEWHESSTTRWLTVTDSSTGKPTAEVPMCTADEVRAAIDSAAAAFPAWAGKPIAVRTQVMFRFKSLIEANIEELARVTSQELGKNLDEARGEYVKVIEACEVAVAAPMLSQGQSMMNVSAGHDTVTYREPMGVFAGIAPFNFPAMIPFGWMIPLAITTGNTFVLKAASMVPLSGMRLMDLLQQAGLPKGVVNLITCGRNEAEILLTHPAVAGVSFVGSTETGRHIYSVAAAHGKRVQAQTEAKNHALVLRDASLERSVRGIVNATLGCAGMRCMALPVICVEDVIADDFIRLFLQIAKERVVGCAYDPKTELGPVVSAEHKKFVSDWIAKGVAEGAELILDGRELVVPGFEQGFFIGPTVFDHVKAEHTCGTEEVFGPVTFVKRIQDFEEGLAIANGNRFANGSSIFTESGYYAREFAKRSDAGMVGINVGIPVPSSFFPFSGHKQSFFGDKHVLGRDGIDFYTQLKAVTTHWFSDEEKKATKVGTWEGMTNRR